MIWENSPGYRHCSETIIMWLICFNSLTKCNLDPRRPRRPIATLIYVTRGDVACEGGFDYVSAVDAKALLQDFRAA